MAIILTRPDARPRMLMTWLRIAPIRRSPKDHARRFTAEYRLRILEEGDRTAEPGEVGRIVSAPQRWHCVGNGSFPLIAGGTTDAESAGRAVGPW
jgi:hypothetical protein